jgi:hypothetical protein
MVKHVCFATEVPKKPFEPSWAFGFQVKTYATFANCDFQDKLPGERKPLSLVLQGKGPFKLNAAGK